MSSLETASETPRPSLPDLFSGFLKIGLMGFGGVGPVARHIIVAERKWLDDRGYAELMGICQALPGANTVNAAVMLGDQFRRNRRLDLRLRADGDAATVPGRARQWL